MQGLQEELARNFLSQIQRVKEPPSQEKARPAANGVVPTARRSKPIPPAPMELHRLLRVPTWSTSRSAGLKKKAALQLRREKDAKERVGPHRVPVPKPVPAAIDSCTIGSHDRQRKKPLVSGVHNSQVEIVHYTL